MDRLTINNDLFFSDVLELLREGKSVTIPVKGSSMLPFIAGGKDFVVLEGVEAGTPAGLDRREAKAGDIVLFCLSGKFIMHRILSFSGGTAEIQGDGILKAKEHCDRDQIFGKVVTVLKDGRRPVDVSSSSHRLKVRIWLALSPVRRILLAVLKRFA